MPQEYEIENMNNPKGSSGTEPIEARCRPDPQVMATVQKGLSMMNQAIRNSNNLPAGAEFRSLETLSFFHDISHKLSSNVIHQLNSLLKTELPSFSLKEGDVEFNMERITDANDALLDRINTHIDCENKGVEPSQTKEAHVEGQGVYSPIITTIKVGTTSFIGAKNITRPQLLFKDEIDNSSSLWVPKITYKPNNIKPLSFQILTNLEGEEIGYEHPYDTELNLFQPPSEWLVEDEEELPPIPPPPEKTKLTYVDTEAGLDELVKHLQSVTEIGVDLEHHFFRSYQGFTCLIQMTTEAGDFIIDSLALREHLHKLNEVMTNPKILKVFHGADNDIRWLQRDFGVYVVGMFDTHQAACKLNFSNKSLKALLERYCRIDVSKFGQKADWRIRPLTPDLLQYARTDTHYLLYIWRRMRKDLLKACNGKPQDLLKVFENSRQLCLLTYSKPVLTADSHMNLFRRNLKRYSRFNTRQMAALRTLYKWRDEQARTLDESTEYLLPNIMLLALAEKLPRELQGVSSLCSPEPPFVKKNLVTIHKMILSCRELPAEMQQDESGAPLVGVELPPPDYDVHDVDDCDDGEEADYPDSASNEDSNERRLASELGLPSSIMLEVNAAVVPDVETFNEDNKRETKLKTEVEHFLSPYERYRKYRILAQVQYQERAEAISKENQAIAAAALHDSKLAKLPAENCITNVLSDENVKQCEISPSIGKVTVTPLQKTSEEETVVEQPSTKEERKKRRGKKRRLEKAKARGENETGETVPSGGDAIAWSSKKPEENSATDPVPSKRRRKRRGKHFNDNSTW